MFEYDICRCGNADKCPHKENCERAKRDLPAGIYTYSDFYKEGEKCEYYWEIKKEKIIC